MLPCAVAKLEPIVVFLGDTNNVRNGVVVEKEMGNVTVTASPAVSGAETTPPWPKGEALPIRQMLIIHIGNIL